MKAFRPGVRVLVACLLVAAALVAGASSAVFGLCGPFTDVSDAGFCPFVLEIFYLGITTGTTPTTYDPSSSVNRLQMAAFLSRSVDGVLKRGSRRAALNQFSNTLLVNIPQTTVGDSPELLQSDGADLWVPNLFGASVSRVRGSDGRGLETWTGAGGAHGVLVALGRVFVAGDLNPGKLYQIDPRLPAGAVTTVATDLGGLSLQLAFDGLRIWSSNLAGSVSITVPLVTTPWPVATETAGFDQVKGIVYDGANIWVTDQAAGKLFKLNTAGAIIQTVTVGDGASFPAFDGTNIWVPNRLDSSISVVRASTGVVLATLTGNGLSGPNAAAFDGQRVLVTDSDKITLWKAADLTGLGSLATGASTFPTGACSDGVNFWIALAGTDRLLRF